MKNNLFLIAHNIRSAHNVGALLRTAEGAGIEKVYLTGYTPSPYDPKQNPAITKAQKDLAKTALGTENVVSWKKKKDIAVLIGSLKKMKIKILALELDREAKNIFSYQCRFPSALLVGNEVSGIDKKILKSADKILYIPMQGKKESLNVSVAAGIAMYQLLK